MSESKLHKFEIDLDEIERQLRRSAPVQPSPVPPVNPDPLAELARIVGQNDPFSSILGEPPPAEPKASAVAGPTGISEEEREILGADDGAAPPVPAPAREVRFDPVADAYGSPENALGRSDFEPLPERRSRGRLLATVVVLGLAVLGTAGGLTLYRRGGSGFVASGTPPLIKADNAPLKVAPANPGGMEIPDQNKQIYERNAGDGKSRVVDRQEQPLDVREVARALPEPEPAPAAVTQPQPASMPSPPVAVTQSPPATPSSLPAAPMVPTSAPQVSAALDRTMAPTIASQASPAVTVSSRPSASSNAVLNALGEPRRVRTVAVRPDGSAFDGPPVPTAPETSLTIPGAALPAPVAVATVPIPLSAATSAPPSAAPSGPVVATLPPLRPRPDGGGAAAPGQSLDPPPPDSAALSAFIADDAPDQAGAVKVMPPLRPRQLAWAPAAAVAEPTEAGAGQAAEGRSWAVQIATRPTEAEARTAYDKLTDTYAADLGGKPATVTRADVKGKVVYRVRVTPLSRTDATTLCTRLKSSGAACFVAAN